MPRRKHNIFATNEAAAVAVVFRTNVSAVLRTEQYEGQEHIVAPCQMITEGVHNRRYYPPKELQKSVPAWNSRVVTAFHPTDLEGNQVPAGNPRTIEEFGLGTVFNTGFNAKTKKLHAELWINKAKAEKLEAGRDVLARLAKNEVIEVSTGLFLDEDDVAGVWNKEDYDTSTANYRPDHLALLPGGQGSCSVGDGAGFPRFNAEENPAPAHMVEHFSRLIANRDVSLDRRREELLELVRPLFPQTDWIYVVDLREQTFIVEVDVKDEAPSIYQIGYSVLPSGSVSLDADPPVEVEKVYQPKENVTVNKKQMIQNLIDNSGQWTEEDRATLEGMDEALIVKINATVPPKTETPVPPVPPKTETPVPPKTETPVPAMNMEQFRKIAPPEFLSFMDNAQKVEAAKTAGLIAALVANARCALTEDMLKAMAPAALAALHQSLGGQADFSLNTPGATPRIANNDEIDSEPPSWDWATDKLAVKASASA